MCKSYFCIFEGHQKQNTVTKNNLIILEKKDNLGENDFLTNFANSF